MSTHSAKKKRIGSRRRVTNQNKTSEDDEFLVKDSSAVTQHNIPEKNPESVSAFAHPDHSSSLTQNPPSPELSGNRRKFGSSRRNRGGRHVRDSATELHHNPTEEVEEKTESIESPERTQMSAAIQPEKQETFSQGSEHDMSGTYESLLCLSEEKLTNEHSARETESNDVEVNTEVLRQDGNFHSNYLMSESEAELAAIHFAATPEITTDDSSTKDHTEVEPNVVQETVKSPNEELSTKEEQQTLSRISEEDQHLYDDVSKASEEEMKQTRIYEMENSEGLVHDRHASENLSRNPVDQAEASNVQDLEFTEKSTTDSDDFTKPDSPVLHDKEDKQPEIDNSEAFDNKDEDEPLTSDTDRVDTELGQMDETGGRGDDKMKLTTDQIFHQESEITIPDLDLSRSTLGVLQSEKKSLFQFQPQDSYTTQDEHNTDLNSFGNRRKLGSSRRNKVRQQVEDPAVESHHKPSLEVLENIEGTEESEREKMSLAIETAVQEKSMQSTLEEMVKSDSHQTEGQVSEIQQFLGTADENSPEDHPGTGYNTEKATFASHTGEWSTAEEQIDTLPEVQGAHQSGNAENTVQATEPVQMQEMLEMDQSFENVIYDATGYSEIVSRSPLNQVICDTLGQSDLSMETTSESVTKQDDSNPDAAQGEHLTKENNIDTFDSRNDDYDEEPLISDRRKVDTALGQIEGREEGDTKLSTEQTDHLERSELFGETEESKTFQTLQSEIHVSVNTQPLQPNCSFDSTAADSYQKPAEEKVEETEDNEPLKTKIISSTSETAVMDFSIGTTLEEVNTFDTASPQDVSDEVKCKADVSTPVDVSELTSSNLHSSSTAGQKFDIQQSLTEVQNEELPNLYSVTIEESDGDSKLLKSHVNLQNNHSVSETCSKSEDTDSFVVLETTTETFSTKEIADSESNIECTEFSSPNEELGTNEAQNKIFRFVEVMGALHPSDALTEVHKHGEEIQEIQDIHESSERTADDTTGNSSSGRVSDTYKPEMIEQSIDSATMQDNPDTDDSLLNNMKKEEVLSDVKELDTISPCDDPPQDPPHSYEEQTCTSFNPIKSHKKLGSSRRYKDRKQVKDPVPGLYHEHMVSEKLEISQTEKESQEELSQDSEYASTMPETHEGPSASIHSGVQSPTTDNHPETDLQSFIHIRESVQQDHDDRGTDFSVEESDKPVGVTFDEVENSDTHQNEDLKGACPSEESLGEVHVQDVESQQMQEVLQTNIYSENVMDDAEKKLVGLIAEAEVSNTYESELTVKKSDDSQGELEESHPYEKLDEEPINYVRMEASDLGKTVYHDDSKNLHQIETEDGEATAPGHLDKIEICKDSDIKTCDEKTVFQEKEGVFFGVKDGESSSQTLSEKHTPNSQDQQVDYEQDKNLAVEAYCGLTVEDFQGALLKTKILPKEDTAVNTADTTQIEEGGDDTHIGTLVGKPFILSSNSTVDQQHFDQSNSTEMPEEELPKVDDIPEKEKKESDMEEELFRLDGNLLSNYVLTDYALAQELAAKKKQSGKNTENENIVEQTACLTSQGLLNKNQEEKEHLTPGDTMDEILEEPIQVQEVHEVMTAATETESSVETQQCDINFSLDSEPQQLDNNVNPLRTRRKLGSSRRNKRQQKDSEASDKSQEDFVEKESSDEALHIKTTDMFAMDNIELEESEEHTDVYPRSTVEIGKDKENTNTVLSGRFIDSSAIETTPITSSLGRGDLAESCQGMNEDENIQPRNLSALASHETVKFVLIESAESACKDDSDMQNTPCQDDIASARSFSSDPLEQEDDFDQNKEALSYDKGTEISMQQTNDAVETEGDVTVNDNYTEADTSTKFQFTDKDEDEEKFQEPMEKDHKAQDIMASEEIIPSELFTASHKSGSSAQSDAGLVANIRVESPVAVTEQSGTSTAVSAMDSQHEVQEQTVLDDSESLQEKSKQRKRRFGSNRRILHKVNQEEAPQNRDETSDREFNMSTEAKKSEKIKVMEEFPVHVSAEVSQDEKMETSRSSVSIIQQETDETSSVLDKGLKLLISTPDPESVESSMISDKKVLLSSVMEEYANNGVTGESGVSSVETTQDAQIEEERPESTNTIQNRVLESTEEQVQAVGDLGTGQSVGNGGEEKQQSAEVCTQESSTVTEEGQNTSLEIKDSNPVFGSTSQRRKIGSTRKSLRPKAKEDSAQKHEVHKEAVATTINAEDEKTDDFSDIKEEVLQLDIDQTNRESEDKGCDTDKYSFTGDSHLTPSAQQSSAENSVSNSQQQETELHLTPQNLPTMLSTSPKEDVMSELASGGRRRKMGSNRKSRQHQRNGDQTAGEERIEDTQTGSDGGDATEVTVKTTEESQGSLGLPETSEAEKPNQKASPPSSTSEAGQDLKPVGEKTSVQVTPAQHPNTEICLGQETQKTVSLGDNSSKAAGRSNSFHVVMVGDSSVGKTSFMTRARTGKFSLDLPASIGLDSLLWTVVVDGKPVVLQLWDTAGQERFHSITRQIFHKAQAFVLMYDITSSQSFSAVSYWASCIQDGAAEDVTVLLLGNKSDHAGRCVTAQAGESLAKEYNFEFMECSAATGDNVIQSLETVARMLDQKDYTRVEAPVCFAEPQKKKSSGCC